MPDDTRGASAANRIALIVAGAFFMESLDGTIIVTALPAIADSYGVHTLDAGLGVTMYLVAMAAGIPAAGWAAERLGARRVFLLALGLFTFSSLLCALMPSLETFVGARVLQGVAAAFMSPVGRLVVLRETPRHRLIEALGLITWPGLIAPVIGPPLGGLIATHASWRWIFLINVPLGLCGLALVWFLFPVRDKEGTRPPFDRVGFVWTTAALVTLVFGLARLGDGAADSTMALGLLGAGVVLALFAVRHSRRQAAPLLDLRAMKVPTYALAIGTAGFLSRIAINASPFLLPLMFQIGFGWNALQAGSLVLAYMAGNLAMKSITTPLIRRFGFRRVLLVNGALCVICLAACALLSNATPVALLMPLLVVTGMSRSMNFTSITTLAFADVPEQLRAGASALATMLQQIAVVFGVALGTLALALSRDARGAGQLALVDFRNAWLAVAAVMLVSVWFMRRLQPDAGVAISKRVGG